MSLKIINSSLIALVLLIAPVCLAPYNRIIEKQNKINFYKNQTKTIIVSKNIQIRQYFKYIDSIIHNHNALNSYKITEHILVRNNPWIIDTLQNTDYYRMKLRDSFVYDQKSMIALPKGNTIVIPDSITVGRILNKFQKTTIDINIPEFKLRILEDSAKLYEFPIRVGRNEKKYLKMSGRITDLKTIAGKGKIIEHVRNPDYYNPANGHRYYVTRRDDQKVTKLPQIPFLITEINGVINGQLIHPTTNPVTLSKAYSNGCIGTKEADAWVIYYYAPIGTKVNIRYNLKALDSLGSEKILKNIYNYKTLD